MVVKTTHHQLTGEIYHEIGGHSTVVNDLLKAWHKLSDARFSVGWLLLARVFGWGRGASRHDPNQKPWRPTEEKANNLCEAVTISCTASGLHIHMGRIIIAKDRISSVKHQIAVRTGSKPQ